MGIWLAKSGSDAFEKRWTRSVAVPSSLNNQMKGPGTEAAEAAFSEHFAFSVRPGDAEADADMNLIFSVSVFLLSLMSAHSLHFLFESIQFNNNSLSFQIK